MKNHKSVFRIILKDNPWYDQQYDGPHSPLHLAHVPPWNNRNELGRTWLPKNNHNSAFMRAYLKLELQLGTFWAKIEMPHNVCWGNFWHGLQTLLHFLGYHLKPGYFWPTTQLLLPKRAICFQTRPNLAWIQGMSCVAKWSHWLSPLLYRQKTAIINMRAFTHHPVHLHIHAVIQSCSKRTVHQIMHIQVKSFS